MSLLNLFRKNRTSHHVRVAGWVVPDNARCVQCGICSYNCPIGIDVRQHAWLSQPIKDSHCLTCGECVQRCPRGVLSFQRTSLFSAGQPQPESA